MQRSSSQRTDIKPFREMGRTIFMLVLPLVTLTGAKVAGQDSVEVEYLTDVKSVLKARCFACHGTLKQEAELRLDTVAAMQASDILGMDGALLMRITSQDEDLRMPPEGEPLKPEEIRAITKWIEKGAIGPKDEQPEADATSHWAFQRIERPQQGFTAEQRNPIDVYFGGKYKAEGLKPQATAERTILIRRLYLDLTGLPPTVDQLASSDPVEKIIDELLASSQYGERWGRHWMDVWRYSDWYGLGAEVRDSQKHLWRWRDWIVNSLNENKGYDQMVREMLAGDEIAPGDAQTLAATGFLARSWYKFNRTSWLDNTIEHTSKAFMGLTMNCAKCHDHKYDPITHLDYYRLRAVFEPHQVRVDAVPGESDLTKDGLTRVYDGNLEAATYLHLRGDESKPDESELITAGAPSFLAASAWQTPASIELPLESVRPDLQKFVQEEYLASAEAKVTSAQAAFDDMKKQLAELHKEMADTSQLANERDDNAAEEAVVFADDFSTPKPELWQRVGNDLKYEDGKLSVTKPSLEQSYLRSIVKHPRDFEVSLRFKTTGGVKWKSVGLRFDVDQSGKNSQLVYSSVASGGKVHLAHTIEGMETYTSGVVMMPINQGQEYTLNLKVRGTLLNVALDGQFLFAYELPKRSPGVIQLMAYDATAEFLKIDVKRLLADVMLRPAGDAKTSLVTDSEVEKADASLRLARAELGFAKAQVAAENAKYRNEGSGSEELARRLLLEVNLAKAKLELLDSRTASKAADAIKKLEADQAAGKFPNYSPLPASVVSLLITPNVHALPAPDGYPDSSSGRRTALANWLTHRDHPLTARVAVNHIWLRHFGVGLVASETDFGLRAPKPMHQDLLDYLAAELIESGWDMKHLHRLIVSSNVWQRSSSNLEADENTLRADKDNLYYWRMNSRRMESQAIRDSLLFLGGALDLTIGGAPVMASPDVRRRSLYLFHSRDNRSKFLTMFDDADVFACYRRSESIVPQQALAMMNSPFATTAAKQIAATFGETLTPEEFVQTAFLKVVAREPNEAEMKVSLEYLQKQPAREHFVTALINLNDFVMIR